MVAKYVIKYVSVIYKTDLYTHNSPTIPMSSTPHWIELGTWLVWSHITSPPNADTNPLTVYYLIKYVNACDINSQFISQPLIALWQWRLQCQLLPLQPCYPLLLASYVQYIEKWKYLMTLFPISKQKIMLLKVGMIHWKRLHYCPIKFHDRTTHAPDEIAPPKKTRFCCSCPCRLFIVSLDIWNKTQRWWSHPTWLVDIHRTSSTLPSSVVPCIIWQNQTTSSIWEQSPNTTAFNRWHHWYNLLYDTTLLLCWLFSTYDNSLLVEYLNITCALCIKVVFLILFLTNLSMFWCTIWQGAKAFLLGIFLSILILFIKSSRMTWVKITHWFVFYPFHYYIAINKALRVI